jgi:hypothetical protein
MPSQAAVNWTDASGSRDDTGTALEKTLELRRLMERIGLTVEIMSNGDPEKIAVLKALQSGALVPDAAMLENMRKCDAEQEQQAMDFAEGVLVNTKDTNGKYLASMLTYASQEEYLKWYADGVPNHFLIHNAYASRVARVAKAAGVHMVIVPFDEGLYLKWLKEQKLEHGVHALNKWAGNRGMEIAFGSEGTV